MPYTCFVLSFMDYFIIQKNNQQNEFVFFDIFTHLKNGTEFKSNYWTKLVEVLQKNNVQWNHFITKQNIALVI